MNEKVKFREKRIDRLIIILAVFITILFHTVLLLLFSPPVVPDIKIKRITNKIIMLSGSGRNSEVGRSILNWMKYRNPTLISKPSEKFGFERLQAKKHFRKMAEDVSFSEGVNDDNLKVSEFKKLPENEKEDGAHPHRLWNVRAFSPAPNIANVRPLKNKLDFPVWKNSQGDALKQLFPENEKKAVVGEIKKLKPSGETVISIQFCGPELLPRFRIVKSCGFSVLDRKALRALILNSDALFKSGSKSGNIVIEWGPVKAK